MAHSFRHLIALVILACFVSLSHAETPAPARQVKLEFAAAARNAPGSIGYSPLPGKPLQPVLFYGGSRAEPQTYSGDAVVKFYDTSVKTDPVLVATCTVPEGLRNVLFVFIPRAAVQTGAGPKYDVVAVDDSTKQVPLGNFAIINTTNKEYAASYGAAPIRILPGVSKNYASPNITALQLAVAVGSEWREAGRHDFVLNSQTRCWVIIYPPERPTGTYPVIRSLVDESLPPVSNASLARFP